jgi:hypothetical protein
MRRLGGTCVKRVVSMLSHVQTYVTVFANVAMICTFGLSLAIGAAGLTHSKLPIDCKACGPTGKVVAAAERVRV